MNAADALAAGRAYLSAAGWPLDRGYWRDPEPPAVPAAHLPYLYPDNTPGVERAVARERARWTR